MTEQDSKEKSKLTLSLSKDVIQRAKAAGINISEITEKMLTAVTLTPSGNTWEDVKKAYSAFFDSIRKTLSRYGAGVTLLREGNVEITLDEMGFHRIRYLDNGGIDEFVDVDDNWILELGVPLPSPIEILDKVIKVLIERAEINKQNIAELQFALKFVKALSVEEKGDDKH